VVGVQPGLGDRDQADVDFLEPGDVLDDVSQGAAEAVELVDEDEVEAAGGGVVHEALEGGPQVGLRRAARFLVDVGDRPLPQGDQRPALFELGVQAPALDLLLTRHANVDGTAHRVPPLLGMTVALHCEGKARVRQVAAAAPAILIEHAAWIITPSG